MSQATMEGALDSVSSQVSDAFGRITRLQEELRTRLQAVAERERSADEITRVHDELAKRLDGRARELREIEDQIKVRLVDLDRRAAEIEEQHRQRNLQCDEREARVREREGKCDERDIHCTARESRLDEREARVSRREEVADAFQEMLAQMHAALETLAPETIMAALDAGAAYEDRAKSHGSKAAHTPPPDAGEPAKDPIGLTPEEQARFFALRDLGKNDAEILAEIYEARALRNGVPA